MVIAKRAQRHNNLYLLRSSCGSQRLDSAVNPVDVLGEQGLEGGHVGGFVLGPAVAVLVEQEPVLARAAGEHVGETVVVDGGVGEDVGTIVAAATGALEVGDAGGKGTSGGPLGHDLGQGHDAAVEVGSAGDED